MVGAIVTIIGTGPSVGMSIGTVELKAGLTVMVGALVVVMTIGICDGAAIGTAVIGSDEDDDGEDDLLCIIIEANGTPSMLMRTAPPQEPDA
jgi:hypothetical protein